MKTLLILVAAIVLSCGAAWGDDINSRIQFFDGEKWQAIDVEPGKVYSVSSRTGYYGDVFIAKPGTHIREYPNNSDCISDPRKFGGMSGVSITMSGDCNSKVYGIR